LDELNRHEALLRYPYCGVISRCSNQGFGFVSGPAGEEFIHLRDHSGRRLDSMEGFEGKSCAYVVGGHPFRYSQSKRGWENSVVQWRLLDDVEPPLTIRTYKKAREKALLVLDKERLYTFLSAEWYARLWQNKTGENPKAVVRPDEFLDQLLRKRLKEANGAEELIRLLAAICEAPWFVLSETDRPKVCQKFFQPSDWPPRVFIVEKPLASCRGYSKIRPFCGEVLESHVRKVKTVAIDLESNEESIHEFGWKNAAGTGRRTSPTGLNIAELGEAVNECLAGQPDPCVVGHNLLLWDWPILQRHEAPFPESTSLWDTLVASWLLEPWSDSHALIVHENAHQADADAQACFDLFEQQATSLGPCLDGSDYDLHSLVDRLFADPTLLARVDGRDYPSDLRETLDVKTVYPSCRANEIAWQKGCRLELIAAENRLVDPVLLPEQCHRVATEYDSIYAKVIHIVVSDAITHEVEVRLSDLPLWLANDDLRTVLLDAHAEGLLEENGENRMVLHLAEDLFRLEDDEISSQIAEGQLSIAYPGDVASVWQRARRRSLTELEVNEAFPEVVEGRTGRALIPVSDGDGSEQWLLHEPPGLGAAGASWSLLPDIPVWLQTDFELNRGAAEPDVRAWLPRWRDGDASRLDVDHLFVSPDTANRPLYLSDLAHCVLNLMKNCAANEVLLIGMRWYEEAEHLRRNFIQLALTSHHPGSPLRRLEHVCGRGLNVLVCDRNEVSQFSRAAIRLRKKLQIVLDEVPLHDWHALLKRPEPITTAVSDEDVSNIPDADSEEDENDGFELVDLQKHVNRQEILRSEDIRAATSAFLYEWLHGITGPPGIDLAPCLILDARLADHHTAKAMQLSRRDVPFFSLEEDELLTDDVRQVFFEVCYPRREILDIPDDYEAYRLFLRENWGYEDFRPGTQRPAIDSLLGNDRDILLRLPTGAGKSIIFHLPALLRSHYSGRLTIVITPLRALMRDQVEGLWQKHFTESVDYLSGGRDAWINNDVYQGILDGRLRLVFVAPERFRVPRFIEALERRRRLDDGLEFVVFDETHCISEWGFEFRPDYLYAAQYIEEWFKVKDLPGNPHRLLLTSATVTQRNRVDMEKELGLGGAGAYEDLPKDMPHPIQPYIIIESFDLDEDDEAPVDDKFEKIVETLNNLNLDESAALVFVRRRKDCHRLSEALNTFAARSGSGLGSLHALPYHAGLPEAVKKEASDLLNDRKVNVLVCTKAFGMGMDIPHVHACVHHRPPTFIEDYLQEVGRAGRDEKERERTGHDRVTATLLYNQDDIERNLGQLHDKTVKPPDLQDFFGYCLEKGVLFDDVGKSLCIVPTTIRCNETKTFDEDQVTNCLFWLERMQVLRIEGRHPPFLNLGIDMGKLPSYAEGSSLPSKIASLLLDIVGESHRVVGQLEGSGTENSPSLDVENIFSRVVKGLLRGVLALVSPTEQVSVVPPAADAFDQSDKQFSVGEIDVSISTSELMSGSGGISMDDLFVGLIELSKAGVLSIRKNFVVSKNGVLSGEEFWELLHAALERLLQTTNGKVELLPRKDFEIELREWYQGFLLGLSDQETHENQRVDFPKLLTRRVQREVYRSISTSIRILRYAGVDLRESLSESGATQYAWVVPESNRSSITTKVNESVRAMRSLLKCVSGGEERSSQEEVATFEMPLTDVVDALGVEVRISKIKELMKLLESAGFYGFEGTFSEWVSLVSLNTQVPLEPHDPESAAETQVQMVYAEMLEKYEMQVLRAQAMVLLAAMPVENRKDYIDRYFQCIEAKDLSELLEDTVGDVDDEILDTNPMLQELLSQVRQERFSEEMEKLNEGQLEVCKATFDQTLLVNAGPGSGKTHVLRMRCAHLIHAQHIDPTDILVLAFNRAVVYEIRDGIRTLFKALGYGRYANRLDVTTFHSFALRHQKSADHYEEDAIGQAVHTFAEKIKSDEDFARVVGGQYKAVLVDEFQDMNEDFYSVVRSLLMHSGAGMVIGDDDQDILTWNRRIWERKHGQSCPLDAVHYFTQFYEELEPGEHKLTLNYRSVPEVVERTNSMIQTVSERVGFSRMKSEAKLSASRTDQGVIEMPFNPAECIHLAEESLNRGDAAAILCRSNRECRRVYENLIGPGGIPIDRINLMGSEDFSLYQLRHSGALLDICRTRKDYEFVEKFIWEELIEEFENRAFADLQSGRGYLEDLYSLVGEEVGRPRVRDIQKFIEEMHTSDVERLKAKYGLVDNSAKLTVATIHKVKGLEFDTVLVMPSSEKFPFEPSSENVPFERVRKPDVSDAAEEARLYYVAMTRARNRLFIGWGEREKSWLRCKSYNTETGSSRYYLKGSPKEMFVSWPGQERQVQNGLQDYIEKQVCSGDLLRVNKRWLWHGDQTVGRLSNDTAAPPVGPDGQVHLRVSNVIRYTAGEFFRDNNPQFWDPLHETVKDRGWFYTVLAEEAWQQTG
jgi:superfamily II DNA helicase RecQ/superfamily I DNA/RNA helicase